MRKSSALLRRTSRICLNDSEGSTTVLYLLRVSLGVYELTEVKSPPALLGHTLSFELKDLHPEFQNHDFNSDSYSWFGRSEHVASNKLRVNGKTFEANNLKVLQEELNKLKGGLISSDEF